MDTVATDGFQDWEVIDSSSDSESTTLNSVDEIESGSLFQENYFSVDPPKSVEDVDKSSGESDSPSYWADQAMEEDPNRFLHKVSAEPWSDNSSGERSWDGNNELGMSFSDNNEADFEIYGEKEESLGSFCSEIEAGSGKVYAFEENSLVGVEDDVNFAEVSEVVMKENGREQDQKHASDLLGGAVNSSENDEKNDGKVERRRGIVWWKMPMDFLKHFVFKMSPMWTVSVAAAMVGFAILVRRLNRMKNKTKGLQIKVTVNDKKASQVMSRAARMNEAFSIVKRVPVIRQSLPSVGTTAWPVMSMR